VPFDSKIVAITFTNDEADTEVEVELWKAAQASTNASATNVFNWNLLAAGSGGNGPIRSGLINSFASDITFSAGDRLGVYLENGGSTQPSNPIVIIYFDRTALGGSATPGLIETNTDDMDRTP
jgi:hypothetical protein